LIYLENGGLLRLINADSDLSRLSSRLDVEGGEDDSLVKGISCEYSSANDKKSAVKVPTFRRRDRRGYAGNRSRPSKRRKRVDR